jgi:hypothetical protein
LVNAGSVHDTCRSVPAGASSRKLGIFGLSPKIGSSVTAPGCHGPGICVMLDAGTETTGAKR